MPVAEPDVSSTFIAALKLVVEEAEFGLRGQATTTNGSVSGKTVVVSNDRPEVGDLNRNRPMESTDLRKCVECKPIDFAKAKKLRAENCLAHHDIAAVHDPRRR